jgi:hypothetical protein
MSSKVDRADMVALVGLALLLAAVTAWLYLLLHRTGDVYDSHEALLAVASDPGQTAYARGEAVSHLFACYIRPNADVARVRGVFGGCDWVAETTILPIECQSGDGHPIWVKVGGLCFCWSRSPWKGR